MERICRERRERKVKGERNEHLKQKGRGRKRHNGKTAEWRDS